jgi:hypothetical protein
MFASPGRVQRRWNSTCPPGEAAAAHLRRLARKRHWGSATWTEEFSPLPGSDLLAHTAIGIGRPPKSVNRVSGGQKRRLEPGGSTSLEAIRDGRRSNRCAPAQLEAILGCQVSGRTEYIFASSDRFHLRIEARRGNGGLPAAIRIPCTIPAACLRASRPAPRGWQLRDAISLNLRVEGGPFRRPQLLRAGRRHDPVHAQILHHLPIMIKPMRHAEGGKCGPRLKAWLG